MKLKKQVSTQAIIAAALAMGGLILGLAGYFVAVSPEKGKIELIDSQMSAARASLIAAEQAPAKVKVTPAKATDLFRLTQAMPDSADIPGVLISLTQLAGESNVTITGVTPSADVAESTYSQVPLSLTMTGKFPNLLKFFNDMDRSVVIDKAGNLVKVTGRLFVPTSADVSSTDGRTISATVTLDAFVYGSTSTTTTSTTTPATTTST